MGNRTVLYSGHAEEKEHKPGPSRTDPAMSCEERPEANFKKAVTRIGEAAKKARKSSACRNSFVHSTSAKQRISTFLNSPSLFPDLLLSAGKSR